MLNVREQSFQCEYVLKSVNPVYNLFKIGDSLNV